MIQLSYEIWRINQKYVSNHRGACLIVITTLMNNVANNRCINLTFILKMVMFQFLFWYYKSNDFI